MFSGSSHALLTPDGQASCAGPRRTCGPSVPRRWQQKESRWSWKENYLSRDRPSTFWVCRSNFVAIYCL